MRRGRLTYRSTEASIICSTYKDIDIVYDESKNKWKFTLRNQDREAQSLELARQIIDRPVPKGKNPFKRTRCITNDYGGLREVDVTSIAEAFHGTVYVWTVNEEGSKRKMISEHCYPLTAHNKELWQKIRHHQSGIEFRKKAIERLERQLKHLRIEVEESVSRD